MTEEVGEAGWLYVTEILPSGFIKIGCTGSVTNRIRAHAQNLGMSGGHLGAILTLPVASRRTAEIRLLNAVRALPGVSQVPNTKEVFEGASFVEVALVARDLATRFVANIEMDVRDADDFDLDETQNAVLALFRETGREWLPTTEILAHLRGLSIEISPKDLGPRLGSAGSRRRPDPSSSRMVRGYALGDVEASWRRIGLQAVRLKAISSVAG